MQTLVAVPDRPARLWYAHKHIAFLREDQKDAAEITQINANTVNALINAGWEHESAKAAVLEQNMGVLEHTGLVSVQLQPPGVTVAPAGGVGPKAIAARAAEADDDPWGDLDEHSGALLVALAELAGDVARAWDPGKHPRNPKGPGGGRFRSMVDRLKDAIASHLKGDGEGHPFDGFDREQLRRVAKARGIALKRGEDRDSIAKKLLDDIRKGHVGDLVEVAVPPEHNARRYHRNLNQVADMVNTIDGGDIK